MADLEVRDLTVEFESGGYTVRPLDHLSLDAEDGELVVVLGPSGCGKTTLLSCLAGLLTPTSGSITFRGIEVTSLTGAVLAEYRKSTVGVVFQAFNLIPSLTAHANVMAPLRLARVRHRDAVNRADQLLAEVGLSDRASHRPGKMSGGQQQRVAIARALVHDPPLVVADEPTAHLDYLQVEGILVLIRRLASQGRLVLVSTHDDRITHIADRVIELVPHFTGAGREPEEVSVAVGQLIFEQGDRGDLVYVVEEGEVEICRTRANGEEESVAVITPGNYFGELGPILNLPRSASARGRTAARLTSYPLRAFRQRFPGSMTSTASPDQTP
jgi:putative ABC transport system ATP-binding protein